MKLKYKYFAIDFDGTIAYDAYPNIGELIPGAKETMAKIRELGGQIVIWTCRTDEALENAIKFLADNGIEYDKFNESFDHNVNLYGNDTRKVYADIYIDDRSLHFQQQPVDWSLVEEIIFTYESSEWEIGDRIECEQDCMNNFRKGEIFEISYIHHDTDYMSFGPVSGTSISYVKEYFKKVN